MSNACTYSCAGRLDVAIRSGVGWPQCHVVEVANRCHRVSARSGPRSPSIWSGSASCCRSCRSTPAATTPPHCRSTLLVAAFSAASLAVLAAVGPGVGPRRAQAGPDRLPRRHGGREPAHRAGRRTGAAVRRPPHRRRVGRQRLGRPGVRRRHGRAGHRARLFGLLGAAFGLGLRAGPAIGALAALAAPGCRSSSPRPSPASTHVVALRRLPETAPRTARARPPRAPVRLPGVAGARRGGPLVAVSFCTWSPSARSRPRSRSSATAGSGWTSRPTSRSPSSAC